MDTVNATDHAPPPPASPGRLGSLDAFRGLTVALMLLVNNVALDTQTPVQLQHAPFGAGVTVADLVFPWFLFCAGVSIPFSVSSAVRKGALGWRHDVRVLFRAVALVTLGIVVQSAVTNQFSPSLGVLGVIGLASLVGAYLNDLPPFRRAFVALLMLLSYGLSLQFLPHGGGAIGVTRDRNLIQHLNDHILGRYYLNGLPSVIPTGALVAIGTLVGQGLLRDDRRNRLQLLIPAALGLTIVGLEWSVDLAMSKALWTPSYILFSAGLGTAILAVLYVVIDLAKWKAWAFPLVVFGSNAIVAYVVPILVKVLVLQRIHVGDATLMDATLTALKRSMGAVAGGWFYTIAYIVVWWCVAFMLYRRRWFLRV